MIEIRYHHLMCIPRFIGEGYSEEFCENMQRVKDNIASNSYILVDSCDSVCSACPNNIDGICVDEKKVSRYDTAVKKALKKGEVPAPSKICADCKWYGICKKITAV